MLKNTIRGKPFYCETELDERNIDTKKRKKTILYIFSRQLIITCSTFEKRNLKKIIFDLKQFQSHDGRKN